MNTKPYAKNQLYKGACVFDESGEITLPEDSHWIVRSMDEPRTFASSPVKEATIALVLEDVNNHFWPVITFLTKKDATELSVELALFAMKEGVDENSSS